MDSPWEKKTTSDSNIQEQAKYAAQQIWPECAVVKILTADSQKDGSGVNYRMDILVTGKKGSTMHSKLHVELHDPAKQEPKMLLKVEWKTI